MYYGGVHKLQSYRERVGVVTVTFGLLRAKQTLLYRELSVRRGLTEDKWNLFRIGSGMKKLSCP